jgi:REP element-mobilizing transposase RayT
MVDGYRCCSTHPTSSILLTLFENIVGLVLFIRHIDWLRDVVRSVKYRYPFTMHGWVVLPDHLHCVIEWPEGDFDFATRWRLIKMDFSRAKRVGPVDSISMCYTNPINVSDSVKKPVSSPRRRGSMEHERSGISRMDSRIRGNDRAFFLRRSEIS